MTLLKLSKRTIQDLIQQLMQIVRKNHCIQAGLEWDQATQTSIGNQASQDTPNIGSNNETNNFD